MIKVEIIKQPYTTKIYKAVITDDKGHRAETLPFPYTDIKKGLKKKNLDLPPLKNLQFGNNFTATIIIEGRMWGREKRI